jgi:hypothetical protein
MVLLRVGSEAIEGVELGSGSGDRGLVDTNILASDWDVEWAFTAASLGFEGEGDSLGFAFGRRNVRRDLHVLHSGSISRF